MIKHEDLQYINCKAAHIKVAVNYLRSMSYCLINRAAAVWSYMAEEGGESSRSHAPSSSHTHLPPNHPQPHHHLLLPPIQKHARTRCLRSCIEHSETFHLHARPIKLDALRLVIKGIDPLNLYELQFVPAARPVRGLRKAGTSSRVCACCFAVVKERGKGFYSFSSELLTSREEAVWQEEQGREELQRCWWLHANLHIWMLHRTTEAPFFVKTKDALCLLGYSSSVLHLWFLIPLTSLGGSFLSLKYLLKLIDESDRGNIWLGFYSLRACVKCNKAMQTRWSVIVGTKSNQEKKSDRKEDWAKEKVL